MDDRITCFAETNFRNERKRFGIRKKDRRYHMYVVGKTGVGKSTLLLNMVKQDIENGEGMALLDPHGDLIEKALKAIPESRIKDLIYFNPQDKEQTLYFNPLEVLNRSESHLVVSSLVSVFKKIWADSWGPRLEYILRNALSTLVEFSNSTLVDLQRILRDRDFRMKVIDRLKNEQLKNFWLNEFEKYSPNFQQEAVSPIQNKIGQFLNNPILKEIVSQPKSSFNLREIMDSGKILLVNLSKGKIGEDSASLLGAMLIAKMGLSALSRQDIPEEKRKDFYLYVDEFQSFATSSFADILSEARKYHLNLILANQYLDQIDEKVRGAIFGNVGTIISFKVGLEDAKFLAEEFYPKFSQEDLINLPCYSIYLRLMIEGKTSKPFSGESLWLQ
ncbi:MAG: type IV secretion system DNA-binding domain-containing protein [Candidatus Omnitrophota bacterium]|nr:type IV secretion system DNA-binding domain-containing protein [Candidatus Omnitrophota bacterium]